MWSTFLYGLIGLQYLAQFPYLSHNQHSVSVFPQYLIAQLPPSFPIQTFSTYSAVELTVNREIYKYEPWYQVQFRYQCIKQSINQFSNTQRSVTTVAYDELRWSSVSNNLPPTLILHLAEAKCSLSPIAAVCMQSVECVEGFCKIENSPIETGWSYLINQLRPEMYEMLTGEIRRQILRLWGCSIWIFYQLACL
jgi:hypothetical protein